MVMVAAGAAKASKDGGGDGTGGKGGIRWGLKTRISDGNGNDGGKVEAVFVVLLRE